MALLGFTKLLGNLFKWTDSWTDPNESSFSRKYYNFVKELISIKKAFLRCKLSFIFSTSFARASCSTKQEIIEDDLKKVISFGDNRSKKISKIFDKLFIIVSFKYLYFNLYLYLYFFFFFFVCVIISLLPQKLSFYHDGSMVDKKMWFSVLLSLCVCKRFSSDAEYVGR